MSAGYFQRQVTNQVTCLWLFGLGEYGAVEGAIPFPAGDESHHTGASFSYGGILSQRRLKALRGEKRPYSLRYYKGLP